MRLGVDTGGTFTDFVWLDENGRFHIHKQLSTPTDPSNAILTGIQLHNIPTSTEVIHGTTVATNALLERQGARTALITTQGFADVLAIGRQNRPDLYALVPQKPEPLVPKQWRFEVPERITAQGDILQPLNIASLQPILQQLAADNIESVAICLLFSFLRPEHEQLIKSVIQNSSFHVSLSSEILPEYREYERTATTVINAYVAPLMSHYLARLAEGLHPRRLSVMQSNGGIISAQTASNQAARTALSGPAGGVVGAQYVAQLAGFPHIITFDMGGTSTDVALCAGQIPTTSAGEIADLPLRLPIIDIHTVGAGGGSLAYVDAGGALQSGPQSAGADPGPACYGNRRSKIKESGSSTPSATTTDANLVLRRLDANHFLGGEMKLIDAAAEQALTKLAAEMGIDSAKTAALGVIQVANAHMERAIRKISVERGYDPRRFTLVPFGGAGPLHACELAVNLQIPRILIPAVPGVLSALGMLVAAPTKDYSRTVLQKIEELRLEIGDWLREETGLLQDQAFTEMIAEGYAKEDIALRFSLDMRYVGQSHELKVPFVWSATEHIVDDFHTTHENRFGYQQPEADVEVVNVRITAVAPVTPPQISKQPFTHTSAEEACIGEKEVWFNQKPYTTHLYDRDKLLPGHTFPGPAIVFQYDTTTVITPEWKTAVDAYGNLILTIQT